jgi:DNA-binding beta-propeller fold protein YncE
VLKFRTLALCATSIISTWPAAAASPMPKVVRQIPLHDGGWDILTVDPASNRVLISRSDGVDAVDTRTGAVTPRLISGTRFHGVSLVPGTPLAVATQAAGSAVVFNVSSGRVSGEVKTDADADATIYEPSTRTVWVMNGDSGTISIVDPIALKSLATIKLGSALEFAALDGRGQLFVNLTDKGEIAEVNIAKRTITRTIPLAGCQHPTGLAYVNSGILISACANGVAKLVRAVDGAAIGEIAIGPRPDGAFADEARHRAYIPSGGDGTLTVIDTSGPVPRKIAAVPTAVGARTGTVDAATGTVYLPSAKFTAPVSAGARPTLVPGSVGLLVVQ